MSTDDIELGPIDVVLIGYPKDAPMTGEAAAIMMDLVDRGIIRVLDALLIFKEEDGTFSGIAAQNLTAETVGDWTIFEGATSGLLDDDDAASAAEAMEPGEAALLLMYENRWAAPFATAVRRNGGFLIDSQRIPVTDVLAALERAGA